MTTIKTSYKRRSFLKVSTAASGGFVLGFSLLAGCKTDVIDKSIEKLIMPDNWFGMNGFLKIGDNGVVSIMSPNPEIGQNIKTSMPMIVAEELDVDWKKVVVKQAGLDTKNFTRQLAGGSQSIRHGWKSLRMTGATARRMLLEAAAERLSVPVDELTTDSGVIHHVKTNQSLGYGEVAADAVSVQVPEEVALKDPKDFKIIGKTTLNVDGRSIVTGGPLFGIDQEEDGMKIAMLIHPPAFGMTIKAVDDSEAKGMPGITDIVRVSTKFGKDSAQWSDVNAFTEIVAIVGDSTWQVMKAKKAVKVSWDRESKGEDSALHTSSLKEALAKGEGKQDRLDGDPALAFKNAAQIVEKTYTAPFLPHNTMEPMNFFADVSETEAKVAGPIQTPEYLLKSLSSILSLPEDSIDIMMTRMGGGFGRRLYGNFAVEAAVISQQVKKPIKLVYTREDDMSQGVYRPSYSVTYKAGLDTDGKLTAISIKAAGIADSPRGGQLVFPNRFPAGSVDHYEAWNHHIPTNISTGAWRAPRSNFIAGAEQSFLDEVAEAAGKDPIDFRLELFDKATKSPVGKENDYDAERYAGVLRLVKERSGWDQDRPNVSRGVAAYYCHNSYVAQVVDIIKEDDKPVIKKVWCAVDCGIVVNPTGAKNQIEGGAIDGIGTAMYGGLTFKDGKPEQDNFGHYQMIRMADAPIEIETFFVDNGIEPTGLGEPGMPPVIGALANALYKATGKRFYNQPFSKDNDKLLG